MTYDFYFSKSFLIPLFFQMIFKVKLCIRFLRLKTRKYYLKEIRPDYLYNGTKFWGSVLPIPFAIFLQVFIFFSLLHFFPAIQDKNIPLLYYVAHLPFTLSLYYLSRVLIFQIALCALENYIIRTRPNYVFYPEEIDYFLTNNDFKFKQWGTFNHFAFNDLNNSWYVRVIVSNNIIVILWFSIFSLILFFILLPVVNLLQPSWRTLLVVFIITLKYVTLFTGLLVYIINIIIFRFKLLRLKYDKTLPRKYLLRDFYIKKD